MPQGIRGSSCNRVPVREASECAQSSSTTSFQDQVQAATRVCAPTLAIACHRLPSLASASAARTVPPDPDCAHTACAFVTAMGSIPFLKQLEPGIRPCLSLPSTHSTVQAALIEEDVREARSNDASDAPIIQSPRPHRSQVPAASDLWSPRAQENGRNTHARVMSHILGCHSYECELATSMAR